MFIGKKYYVNSSLNQTLCLPEENMQTLIKQVKTFISKVKNNSYYKKL